MTVTTHMKALEIKAMATRIGCRRGYNSFTQEGQALGGLEGRTWRILSHDTAVEQGFPLILTQDVMVLTALTTNHHTRVIRRR